MWDACLRGLPAANIGRRCRTSWSMFRGAALGGACICGCSANANDVGELLVPLELATAPVQVGRVAICGARTRRSKDRDIVDRPGLWTERKAVAPAQLTGDERRGGLSVEGVPCWAMSSYARG